MATTEYYLDKTGLEEALTAVKNGTQAPLVSGTNIKTVNGTSLLGSGDVSTLAFGNYSTSEIDTGFTWVDGKAIYKKTIDFGALPNNTTKSVAHNITNLDKIIKVEQHINNGSSNAKGFLILASTPANTTGFNLYGNNTQICIATNSDRSGVTAYITLFYTKTSS